MVSMHDSTCLKYYGYHSFVALDVFPQRKRAMNYCRQEIRTRSFFNTEQNFEFYLRPQIIRCDSSDSDLFL